MKPKTSIFAIFAILLAGFFPKAALAHCPLCTAGAVAIGIGAYKLGVSTFSVGVAIGAFAMALGLWMAKLVHRRFIPKQKAILALVIFATTIIPIMPFMPGAFGIYLARWGQYGTTLAISRFLLGSLLGGALVIAAPGLSGALKALRAGRALPFQGMGITLGLIVLAIATAEILL